MLRHTNFIAFLLSTILSYYSGNAQETTFSELKKISSKSNQYSILGKNNEGVILYEYGKNTNIIEAYSDVMRFKWKKNLNIKQNDAQISKIILYPEETNFIYTAHENGIWRVFAQSMDEKFMRGFKFVQIDSLDYGKENFHDIIKTIHSENKEKILSFYPIQGQNALKFILLNKKLEILTSQIVNFPLPNGDFALDDVLIDNEGNIFISLVNNSRLKKGEPNLDRYKYFALDASMQMTTEINFQFQKTIYGRPKLLFDNVNHQLIITGFFSDEDIKQAKGYFFKAISAEDNTLVKDYHFAFNPDIYKQITGKESGQNLNGLSTFEITDVIIRFDGGIIFVAESRFKTVENLMLPSFVPAAGPSYRSVTINHYNDILVAAVSPGGQQEWLNLLRKKQVSEDDDGYFSSYALHIRGDQLNFIFNEEIFQKTNVGGYKIEPSGDKHRVTAFKASEQDILVVPRLGKQISSNELVVPAFKKNNLRLIKLFYR